MDMCHNIAAAQRFHGIAENVTTGGLRNVFHELGTVGFQPSPLLCAAYPLISYIVRAESVHANARLDVSEVPARRKRDK